MTSTKNCIKKYTRITLLLLIASFLTPNNATATPSYVMIVTPQQLSSHYYCKIENGKYSITEFRSGKSDAQYPTSTVLNKLNSQLSTANSSLTSVKNSLRGKLSSSERTRLENKRDQLTSQIADLKSIISQVQSCSRGKLTTPSNKPVFIYQTFKPSGNQSVGKVSTFLYGIMIDKPSSYTSGTTYCALLPGIRNVGSYVTSPDPIFKANSYNISQTLGTETFPGLKVPLVFFSGDFQTEGIVAPIAVESKGKFIIAFAWGYVREAPGTCTKPLECSVEALRKSLKQLYGSITLQSGITPLTGSTCDE